MGLKLKVREVDELVDGFNELVQKEMNVSLALKVKINAKKINEAINIIGEMKNSIVSKYDLENKEDHSKALSELSELDNQEIDIDLQMFKISEIEKSDISIKPSVLVNLEPIITDDTEKENAGKEE